MDKEVYIPRNIREEQERERYEKALLEIKEYIENENINFYTEEPHYRDLITIDSVEILEIINKALNN